MTINIPEIILTDQDGIRDVLHDCVMHFRGLILDEIKAKCCIAGGALINYFTGQEGRDIDLFFESEEDMLAAVSFFDGKVPQIYNTSNSYGYNYKNIIFDLVKVQRRIGNPAEIISGFDFTICAAGVDSSMVYFHRRFFVDLAMKKLVVNNPKNPARTIDRRLQKYIKRGFSIEPEEAQKIIKALREVGDQEITSAFQPDADDYKAIL